MEFRIADTFTHLPEAELLAYGVPPEWLAEVRQATEDTVLSLADHLPAEAAEALLELATGGTPQKPGAVAPAIDPFEHPDARRRFRVATDVDELERALEYSWERWIVFLHPAQRSLVERGFAGPARIARRLGRHGKDRRRAPSGGASCASRPKDAATREAAAGALVGLRAGPGFVISCTSRARERATTCW